MKSIEIKKQRGKYGSAKDKALTPNKRNEILNSITDNKNRVLFILGSYAGLRVGEIHQLRTSWLERVKIDNKEVLAINIPNECRDISNKYALWRPKTKNGRTSYIIDKELYLEVENFYKYNESIKLSIRGLQERCYKLCGVSIHSLRATAQNYMKYELNYPTEVIATILGHKDIRTTLQHYNSMNRAQVEAYLIKQEVKNFT